MVPKLSDHHFFAIWELLPRFGIVSTAFLSPPTEVLVAIKDLISTGDLWIHVRAVCSDLCRDWS